MFSDHLTVSLNRSLTRNALFKDSSLFVLIFRFKTGLSLFYIVFRQEVGQITVEYNIVSIFECRENIKTCLK